MFLQKRSLHCQRSVAPLSGTALPGHLFRVSSVQIWLLFDLSPLSFLLNWQRMTYSASEIAEILAQYSENQFSLRQFAKDQGIADFTLRKWLSGWRKQSTQEEWRKCRLSAQLEQKLHTPWRSLSEEMVKSWRPSLCLRLLAKISRRSRSPSIRSWRFQQMSSSKDPQADGGMQHSTQSWWRSCFPRQRTTKIMSTQRRRRPETWRIPQNRILLTGSRKRGITLHQNWFESRSQTLFGNTLKEKNEVCCCFQSNRWLLRCSGTKWYHVCNFPPSGWPFLFSLSDVIKNVL